MLKNFKSLLFVILIIGSCKKKSNDIDLSYDKDCDLGIKKANEDFQNDKISMTTSDSFFLTDSYNVDFEIFYKEIMLQKYGIKKGKYSFGCIVKENHIIDNCYSQKMNELILTKYGDNFFQETRISAKERYKKEVFNRIDNDIIFHNLDSLPKCLEESKKYLKQSTLSELNLDGRILAKFIVEKDGSLSDIRIIRRENIDSLYDNQIIDILKKSPKWLPGKVLGKKVRSYGHLPIGFKKKV